MSPVLFFISNLLNPDLLESDGLVVDRGDIKRAPVGHVQGPIANRGHGAGQVDRDLVDISVERARIKGGQGEGDGRGGVVIVVIDRVGGYFVH